jgi:hypothetical protein
MRRMLFTGWMRYSKFKKIIIMEVICKPSYKKDAMKFNV